MNEQTKSDIDKSATSIQAIKAAARATLYFLIVLAAVWAFVVAMRRGPA